MDIEDGRTDIELAEIARAAVDASIKLAGEKGDIVSSADAYYIALEAIVAVTDDEDAKLVRRSLNSCYHEVRKLVAGQLIGMTMGEVSRTVRDACGVFLGREELRLSPRPTLSFTGYCGEDEPWNLLSNAIEAERSAKAADPVHDERHRALLRNLAKSLQLLHFVCNGEIPQDDLSKAVFDGELRAVH